MLKLFDDVLMIYLYIYILHLIFSYYLVTLWSGKHTKIMEHHHDINQRTFYGHFQWQTAGHYQKVFPQSTLKLRKLTP